MVGAISAYSGGMYTSGYFSFQRSGAAAMRTEQRAAQPESPVEPVRPVTPVRSATAAPANDGMPVLRKGVDPVEMAVRMRIEYVQPNGEQKAVPTLPGGKEEPKLDAMGEELGVEGAQKAAEEGECQTCKERKYQDGSDDMSVSFQTPTRIDPKAVASAVRGHEMEHVSHEQAKAQRENRKVVSQSVTLHTAICPECGKAYISGGTTRTSTVSKPEPVKPEAAEEKGFSAVA